MAIGREEVRRLDISVSSGTGSGNINRTWDLSRRVRVIPPAETDSYDVSIKDSDSHRIFQRTGQVGTLSELQGLSLGILSSVSIANATTDGTYVVKFDMH